MLMLGSHARKLPLFTGADPGMAGQRRGSGSGGELAPGGCALAQRRPFLTASLRGNAGAPGTGLPRASVSCVPPLWCLGCVQGTRWDALEAGLSGVLRTL